jgi:hypothetical protein
MLLRKMLEISLQKAFWHPYEHYHLDSDKSFLMTKTQVKIVNKIHTERIGYGSIF